MEEVRRRMLRDICEEMRTAKFGRKKKVKKRRIRAGWKRRMRRNSLSGKQKRVKRRRSENQTWKRE